MVSVHLCITVYILYIHATYANQLCITPQGNPLCINPNYVKHLTTSLKKLRYLDSHPLPNALKQFQQHPTPTDGSDDADNLASESTHYANN